ncbi:MAG: sulfatase [Pseudomonadota bacterium]
MRNDRNTEAVGLAYLLRARLLCCLSLILLSACGPQSASVTNSSEESAAKKPNFIILFADDLGYGDLANYGHPSIKTPQLDQMAREGQRWTDFYVASPVCSPSRGALMTGNYPARSGLYGKVRAVLFPGDVGAIPSETITLPEALRDLGYTTAMFGKWHLGDQPDGLPTRHGFDSWLGTPYSNDMDWEVGPSSKELFAARARGERTFIQEAIARRLEYSVAPENHYWNVPLIESLRGPDGYEDRIVERPVLQSNLTATFTELAVEFIHSQAETDQSFFLYVAYAMPHVPLFPGEDFIGASDAGRYGDTIEELDWSAGEIQQAIENAGLADNTIIVFTSDNGPWIRMGRHGGSAGPLKDGKATTFEGGLRVPGIFWGPGIIKPTTVHGLGSTLDLYATFVSLAGGQIDKSVVDSIDLSPAFAGAESPRTEFAYYRQAQLYAYRSGLYKTHFITQGAYGAPPNKQTHSPALLYHLGEDPGEKWNIAADAPEKLQEVIAAANAHSEGMTLAPPLFDVGRD